VNGPSARPGMALAHPDQGEFLDASHAPETLASG
jgi:hypothetical protein